jgi:hypothetical protein
VTEIGFPPSAENWQELDAAWGPLDLQAQAQMLAHFAQALKSARASFTDFRGAYLWCWTTDPGGGPALGRSYTLQNPPAAAVVPQLFH